jgi:hypothetical protein
MLAHVSYRGHCLERVRSQAGHKSRLESTSVHIRESLCPGFEKHGASFVIQGNARVGGES